MTDTKTKLSENENLSRVLDSIRNLDDLIRIRVAPANPSLAKMLEEVFKVNYHQYANIYKEIVLDLKDIPRFTQQYSFPLKQFSFLLKEIQKVIEVFDRRVQQEIIAQVFRYWWEAEKACEGATSGIILKPTESFHIMIEKISEGLLYNLLVLLEESTYQAVDLLDIRALVLKNFELTVLSEIKEKGACRIAPTLTTLLDTLPSVNRGVIYLHNKADLITEEYQGAQLSVVFPHKLSEIVRAFYALELPRLKAMEELDKKICMGNTKVALIYLDNKLQGLIEMNDYFEIRLIAGLKGGEFFPDVHKFLISLFRKQGWFQVGKNQESLLGLTHKKKGLFR